MGCCVQYIVLGFIGCISVTSLRGFLRNMRKVSCTLMIAYQCTVHPCPTLLGMLQLSSAPAWVIAAVPGSEEAHPVLQSSNCAIINTLTCFYTMSHGSLDAGFCGSVWIWKCIASVALDRADWAVCNLHSPSDTEAAAPQIQVHIPHIAPEPTSLAGLPCIRWHGL